MAENAGGRLRAAVDSTLLPVLRAGGSPMSSTPSRGTLRLLFVEDSEDDSALIVRHLERAGYTVDHFRVETRPSFETALDNAAWDVIISDHSMPRFNSMDALSSIKARKLD